MPNILIGIAAFKKALGAIVSCGLAKGRRSNPAASLRILTIYATPVLMSGLSSLLLSSKEIACIDQQHKKTLQDITKLSSNSPSSLVHFIAGSFPGSAILNLRQFALFGMTSKSSSSAGCTFPTYFFITYFMVCPSEEPPSSVSSSAPLTTPPKSSVKGEF